MSLEEFLFDERNWLLKLGWESNMRDYDGQGEEDVGRFMVWINGNRVEDLPKYIIQKPILS